MTHQRRVGGRSMCLLRSIGLHDFEELQLHTAQQSTGSSLAWGCALWRPLLSTPSIGAWALPQPLPALRTLADYHAQ